MTGQMAWEAPPPLGHGYDWSSIADQLRTNPGEWLRVFENGPISIVNAIRQGSVAAINPIHKAGEPDVGFEVRTRNNRPGPPKTANLYLRWWTPGVE